MNKLQLLVFLLASLLSMDASAIGRSVAAIRPSITPRVPVKINPGPQRLHPGQIAPAMVVPAVITMKQKCKKDDEREHCRKKDQ